MVQGSSEGREGVDHSGESVHRQEGLGKYRIQGGPYEIDALDSVKVDFSFLSLSPMEQKRATALLVIDCISGRDWPLRNQSSRQQKTIIPNGGHNQ